tara:strand:- start:235 stop:885 length:651 start_codon:yes stop_codon:yes gene_type:complete
MSKLAIPRPHAILFDWDNTLVDTWPCITRATNITRKAMGFTPWTADQVRIHVAGSLRDTFPDIYGDRWKEARDIFYNAFSTTHIEMLAALPGAHELLEEASAANLYLAIVSNKTGKYLRAESDHLGWTSFFGCLVGAQDAKKDKPATDPIHLALLQAGIKAGPNVWFVGDASIDIICGKNAHCSTVLLGPNPIDGIQPDMHISDCAALSTLLRSCL